MQITVTTVENAVSAIYLTFKNVVIEKMSLLSDELFRVLNWVAEDVLQDFRIDLKRMNTIIERFVLKQLLALEKRPENEITTNLISDALYGSSNSNVSTCTIIMQYSFVCIKRHDIRNTSAI